MIVALFLLQAAIAEVSPASREKYEPFRKCLVGQSRALTRSDADDQVILDEARSKCMNANLSSGTAAMFAEIKAGATKEQAIDRVAALRMAAEEEALAGIRSIKSSKSSGEK